MNSGVFQRRSSPLFNLIDHIIEQNIIEKKDAILLAGGQHAISCRNDFWRNGRISS